MKSKDYMAWYRYPDPEGKEYSEKDLENPRTVQELFDYCQINLAIISKDGWKKLIKFHGLNELLEINRKSGWFEDNKHEFFDSI